ncbi:MAG: hypothetical protein CSA44_00460 [Gammaproteobacteria bacterium]|nr:MAG: hypothetical protein CSA44_00460 [Gammaproteobacteria bacterium]
MYMNTDCPANINLRKADIQQDLPLLAEMNLALIVDEGHRNSMDIGQLKERMKVWLKSNYQAHLILNDDSVIGYCLWREYREYTYIRQLFISADFRRQGFAKNALLWLKILYGIKPCRLGWRYCQIITMP